MNDKINMLVPMVIEQTPNGERAFDIYSRLLKERIIFLGTGIDDYVSSLVIAQLLFLEADDPKKDMNATYMKSDVRGDVKNGGGTDMSKVNDNPKPMAAMKKINAMYKTEKYLDEKPGSIQNVVAEMYQTGKLKG